MHDLDVREPAKVLGLMENIKEALQQQQWVLDTTSKVASMDLKVGGLNKPLSNIITVAEQAANSVRTVEALIEEFTTEVHKFEANNEDITI